MDASDLIDDIFRILEETETGVSSTFAEDLRERLVEQTKEEISEGKIDERRFEELVASILKSQGATETRIVPRQYDKGADIVAEFNVPIDFTVTVAVQVKYHRETTGIKAIHELIKGMKAEDTKYGWVVTSAKFTEECAQLCEKKKEDGLEISLIDADQLAAIIVDSGLRNLLL